MTMFEWSSEQRESVVAGATDLDPESLNLPPDPKQLGLFGYDANGSEVR